MTVEEYDLLFKKQNGLCAICKQAEKRMHKLGTPQKLSVDHCHNTEVIRGLLCGDCNRGLGLFHDNPELLRMAAEYLENQPLLPIAPHASQPKSSS